MDIEKNKRRFGEKLRKYREEKKLSLRGLARAGGISAVFLMDIERGKLGAPKKGTLDKLVNALELTESERSEFYDLAAKTKREDTIPGDVKEVYMNTPKAGLLMRAIGKMKLNNEEMDRIIKDIENGKYKKEDRNEGGS